MKTDFDELIEAVVVERINLEKELKECLDDGDYQSAQHFSDCLNIINRKLQVLMELDHTNGLKISERKAGLAKLESQLKEEKDENIIRIRKKMIEYLKKDLSELEARPITAYIDSQDLDEVIFKLIENKINGFKLYLVKEANFYLEFSLDSPKVLLIKFTEEKDLKQKDWLKASYVNKVRGLGFNGLGDRQSLALKYDFDQFKDTAGCIELLSRIVFDIYFFKGLDKEMVLEWY
ncbi:MAG: hypothetical protein DHS20C18_16050 [Saprospiraceae bacterium]|nr:MAG: hypothetical protein DHS20C18_16050 [Saprospiraceae bacterium]